MWGKVPIARGHLGCLEGLEKGAETPRGSGMQVGDTQPRSATPWPQQELSLMDTPEQGSLSTNIYFRKVAANMSCSLH